MRVKFIQTFATDRDTFRQDTERDIPDAEAQDYLRIGYAVPAVQPPHEAPAEPPKPAKPAKAK